MSRGLFPLLVPISPLTKRQLVSHRLLRIVMCLLLDTLHVMRLESEVRQLRQALAEERHRNSRILEMLQSQLQTDEVEGSSQENGQLILEGTDQNQHQVIVIWYTYCWEYSVDCPQGKSGLHPCAPGTSLEVRANFCHRDKQESSQAGNDYIKLPALQPRLPGGVAERQRRRQAMQKRVSRTRLPPLQPLT